MPYTILVLNDGETWASSGKILSITDDAYDKLVEGCDPRDLEASEILSTTHVEDNGEQ